MPRYAIELRITLRETTTEKEAENILVELVQEIEKKLHDDESFSKAEVYTY